MSPSLTQKYQTIFPKIIKLVEDGNTISMALKRFDINNTSNFYKAITVEQKRELKRTKLANGSYVPSTKNGFAIPFGLDIINDIIEK